MSLSQIVREAPTGVFVVAFAVIGALAGLPAFVGLRSWRQMRALMSLSRVAVASAKEGYVRVEGHAVPGTEPLSSPLTQSKTCWYHIVVEDSVSPHGSDRDGGAGWSKVREETSSAPFIVRDDSGTIVVDPHGADVIATDHSIWYGPAPEPEDRDPPRFPPGQNPKGNLIQIELGGSKHRYRYTEERIYPDDPIYVQGEVRLDGDEEDDEDYDEDEPAGEAPNATVATAGAATQATDSGKDDTPAPLDEELRIGKPSRRARPYLIATTSPQDMVNVYRWAIIGIVPLTALGLFALFELVRMRFS
ncbi:MAG: GIDE domain-containing protein [Arenicellales bacterium]